MKIIAAKHETNGDGEPCISMSEAPPKEAVAIRFDGTEYAVYEQGDVIPPDHSTNKGDG